MNVTWPATNQVQIAPPKRTKKITGTRFATILGLNPWATPFEMWCAITKTYEKPFEDTIYTLAGKAIEPRQAEYMRKAYAMKLTSPTDVWGQDYFKKTQGDFFPENKHLGGMWDYLMVNEAGNTEAVLEMKTTKRAEDWEDDIPEYYALQVALYAYLLGVDDVIMIASFLQEGDYDHPEEFEPTIENTITVEFKVSERYPDFDRYVKQAEDWWDEYVATGISPVYDEKKDAEILKMLRTNTLSPETDMRALLTEADKLMIEIEKVTATVAEKEKRLKAIKEIVKVAALKKFRDGDTKVTIESPKYEWAILKSESTSVNKKALEEDGLLDKYTVLSPTYRISAKRIEEDK